MEYRNRIYKNDENIFLKVKNIFLSKRNLKIVFDFFGVYN